MSKQRGVILCLPVCQKYEASLERLLEKMQQGLKSNEVFPFSLFSEVHFMRWMLIGSSQSKLTKRIFPSTLIYAADVDGMLRHHIENLFSLASEVVEQLFSYCEGFPSGTNTTRDKKVEYVFSHRVTPGSYYQGHPGIGRDQILNDQKLRSHLSSVIEKDLAGQREVSLEGITEQEPFSCFLSERSNELRLWWKVAIAIRQAAILLLAFVLVAILLPVIGIWLLLLRLLESEDDWLETCGDSTGNTNREAILLNESLISQNQHALVVEVKPGKLRLFTLRMILFLVNIAGGFSFIRRDVLSVPTLHFVSWSLIDGGKRLLFLSNYDGSALQYVADFVDRSPGASLALTAIWSNTFGFPESRWLIQDGASDLPRFLKFLRDHQKHAQVWYSAYPDLSCELIRSNQKLRQRVVEELRGRRWRDWREEI